MSETPAPVIVPLWAVPDVGLRPVTVEDAAFLFELYASTRQEELCATGWDTAQRHAFLQMQFKARAASYRGMFPEAQFEIIFRRRDRIGAWGIHRTGTEIRLIDIALLPAHCGSGVGTALVTELLAEAARNARPVRLHVLQHSRAIRFYERLGFRLCGESGCYHQMVWGEPRAE